MRLWHMALTAGAVVALAACQPYSTGYDPSYGPRYSRPSYPPPPDYGPRITPPPPAREPDSWHVERRRGETVYEMAGDVMFPLDSADITRRADAALDEIARAARREPGAMLIVEGHTDTSGTREHNAELSDDRARAVARELVRRGISRQRIRSQGLGERGLAIQTGDDVREPRNRRVVIRFVNRDRPDRERY